MSYVEAVPVCIQHVQHGYIHTLQLNFLFSEWLFSKYAECIENVHCAQAARGAFGAWSRAWTSHRPIHFFHWVELLIFFMFSGILRSFYLQFFTNMSKWFCFSVVYELGLVWTFLNLMLVQCTRAGPAGLGHWKHQIQCTCIGFVFNISLEKVNTHLLTSN